jgi:hypothetical protein
MKRFASVAALSFFVGSASLAQNPTAPPNSGNLSAYVNHLMEVHIGVERAVPPGWAITVKPVEMQREANGTVSSQVHIFVTGAPAGTVFEQQAIAVGQDTPKPEIGGITIGKDGILMCAGRTPYDCGDPKKPDDPLEFTMMESIKGESYRFLFVSDAGTIGTVIVTNPIANKNNGCALSAIRLTPGFEIALLTAAGLPPDSDIHYIVTPGSDGEKSIHTNALGVARFSILPFVKPGQKSGSVKIKINEKQCSPEVSYDWGRAS